MCANLLDVAPFLPEALHTKRECFEESGAFTPNENDGNIFCSQSKAGDSPLQRLLKLALISQRELQKSMRTVAHRETKQKGRKDFK